MLLAISLVMLTAALAHFKVLSRIDAWWYDSIISTQPLAVPQDVVLINIEPDTLDRRDVSRRQWTKADTAALLARLSESTPAAIYLDDPLHIIDANDSVGEALLAEAIRRIGKVILPVYLVSERSSVTGFRLPTPSHANFSAALCQARITISPDGITRTLPLSVTNGDIEWLHVSAVLAEISQAKGGMLLPAKKYIADDIPRWHDDRQMLIRGVPQGKNFETVTARQVLNGEIDIAGFTSKIVFVGIGSPDGNIAIPGRWGRAQIASRLELFAHAFNTIRTRSWPTAIDGWPATATSGALVLLLLFFYLTRADRQGFAVTVGIIVIIAISSWALLALAGIWFPLAASIGVCVMAYPLWAWRRLASTHRFVASEITRMQNEPGILGETSDPQAAPGSGLIDQQLHAIQEATVKLRAGRKFIADVIESLPIAIAVLDREGKVMLSNNQANVLLAEMPLAKMMGDGGITQQARELELGNQRSLWLVIEPLQIQGADLQSSIAHVAGVAALTDISALKQAQHDREELLRFISHDMRSPLASILALVELRKEAFHEATDDERFKEIAHYASHTILLAEEFLRIAYASASHEGEFQILELRTCIEAALDLTRPLARGRNIEIAYSPHESAQLKGNHNLLVRMFANLLDNAIKFGPTHSCISIHFTKSEQYWDIAIEDQGQTLPPEANTEKGFFQPFFQHYSRLGTNLGLGGPRGIGLGLAFVKVVAQKHNGSIRLERHVGGTRAVLQLPREQEPTRG